MRRNFTSIVDYFERALTTYLLEEVVKKCPICIKHHFNTAKQAIPSELSDGPLQKVAAGLFGLKDQHYQLVIDYLSSYVEIAKLSHTTSSDIVMHLKSKFARHGIPFLLVLHNGPHFSANTFSKFQEEFEFAHITLRPNFPQAKGEVERGVQIVKIHTTVLILPSQLEPCWPYLE